MRLIFLLLFAPLVAISQSLTGFDFSCKTMEILDPVKYSDEYYVIEETRSVDLKVSFYHNNIVITKLKKEIFFFVFLNFSFSLFSSYYY